MKRLVDTFWVVVLVIAVGGVVGGFLGGRSIGRASVGNRGRQSARMPVPDAIVAGHFERVLSGPHSLDMADPDTSAPLGDVVAARPRGWAPAFTPYLHARSKLALVLLDCGHEPRLEKPFIDSRIPFTVACDPKSDSSGELVERAHANGKTVLVAFEPSDLNDHESRAMLEEHYRRWGAQGFIGTTDEESGVSALAAFLAAHHGLAVDTLGDPSAVFYNSTRRRNLTAFTRDVTVDGREEPAYTAFMLRTAVGISRRTGVALVVLHAKPRTYSEVVKFAAFAARDDVELVAVTSL
jgi:polysaccharide deacetylase 2 family uncharacterized protein YibQ